jgi:hypothetical protein
MPAIFFFVSRFNQLVKVRPEQPVLHDAVFLEFGFGEEFRLFVYIRGGATPLPRYIKMNGYAAHFYSATHPAGG